MDYGKDKRTKMMYGSMPRKQKVNGGRMMYNKGGKAGSQPSYSHGEMPKCMPK